MSKKNPVTLAGIETATSRFVAQLVEQDSDGRNIHVDPQSNMVISFVYIRRKQDFGNLRVCSEDLNIASCTHEGYRTSTIFVCVRKPDYCFVYIRRIQDFGNLRVCSEDLIIASCTYEEYRPSAILVFVRKTRLLLSVLTKKTRLRQSSCSFGRPDYCFMYIRRIQNFGNLRVCSET